MTMKYIPREIPEEVNITPIHPLVNLVYLVMTVVGISFLVYFGLGLAADQIAMRISPEVERKIGDKLLPIGLKQVEINDDTRLPHVSDLIQSLNQGKENPKLPLTVHLLDSQEINAAIIPGGHIFITKGLLDAVESENELAFILAHELGHFVARDPLKGLGRSLVFLFVASFVGIGTGNTVGAPDIISVTGELTHLNYSRQQEENADFQAISTVIQYYGHGGDSLQFFEKVKSKDFRNRLSEYFSTHPLTQDRIDKLQQIATANNWQMSGEITPLPEEFRKK